jgi:hypothetical protein
MSQKAIILASKKMLEKLFVKFMELTVVCHAATYFFV